MKSQNHAVLFAVSTIFTASALAAVSEDEAKQLGGPVLTVWGAEKAGNKDGTIPAYTGERIKVPDSFNPKEPDRVPNPWNDKPLFSITPQNHMQYADKLGEGQKAMFKLYPKFRMDVYPSRRTVQYPKYVLDNTLKNATSCKAVNNELRLEGCYGGVPFPIPKTGNQAVWNHTVRYTLHAWTLNTKAITVGPDGKAILQGAYEVHQESPFFDPEMKKSAEPNSMYWKLRFDATEPARKAGERTIILDALDPINPGRRAWQYIPGQRRVKLAPDLAYDTPSPATGGTSTMDESWIFLGAQDRYDMKLAGKKEVFLPYNAFDMNDYKKCPAEVLLTANFPNPDCVRWELHRAWQVVATLKPGFRHIYPKRVMYFDEDSYGAGIADQYDASGRLYRFNMNGFYPLYQLGYGNISDMGIVMDLQTGAWNMTSFVAAPGAGFREEKPKPLTYFSPEALAGEGIR